MSTAQEQEGRKAEFSNKPDDVSAGCSRARVSRQYKEPCLCRDFLFENDLVPEKKKVNGMALGEKTSCDGQGGSFRTTAAEVGNRKGDMQRGYPPWCQRVTPI